MKHWMIISILVFNLAAPVFGRTIGKIERPGDGLWPLSSQVCVDVEEIVILHTSDVHGYVFEREILSPSEDQCVGGLFSLASIIEDRRRELWRWNPAAAIRFARSGKDDGILLLDAGDAISGTYDDFLSQGANTIKLQNSTFLDYDVVTIGNHSVDHGVDVLLRNIAARRCPVVLANVFTDDDSGRPLPGTVPWVVKTVRGVRIGIFGLTHRWSTRIKGYRLEDPDVAARRILPKLRPLCDVVICLAHLGLDYAKESKVRKALADLDNDDPSLNVDIFIDGHSHGNLAFLLDEDTLVVQAGLYGTRAGEIRLRVNRQTKRPVEALVKKHDLSVDRYHPSVRLRNAFSSLVKKAKAENGRVLVDGLDDMFFEKSIRGSSGLENPACEFVVRSLLEVPIGPERIRPDVSVVYQKGVRDHVAANDKGQVTAGILHRILPFGEKINLVNVTGKRLRDLVQYGLRKKFSWAGLRIFYEEGVDENGRFRRALKDLKLWDERKRHWVQVQAEKNYIMACVGFFTRVYVKPKPQDLRVVEETNKGVFEDFLHVYKKNKSAIFTSRDPLYPTLFPR